ncbi:MAG: hypothetical protein V4511_07980 [Bacteroidota bacterium]
MEAIIETIFQDILWAGLRHLGAFIRWIFLQNKFSYKDVLAKSWNGTIGLLFIASLILILYFSFT